MFPVDHQIIDLAASRGIHVINQMLAEYDGEIELVIANNDDMALGAIDALKTSHLKRADWPVVVGIDGTDVGLAAEIGRASCRERVYLCV